MKKIKENKTKPHNHSHSSHPEMIKRLKRVSGHLNKVVSMIEHHEECPDILQQLTAVISALNSARTVLLIDHVNHCYSHSLKPGQENALKEIEVLLKRNIKN